MKLSKNWLANLVDLKNLSAQEIGKKITLHTAELEEIIDQNQFHKDVYGAKLIDVKKHSQNEKLHIGKFDFGREIGEKQIIFGSVHILKIGEVYPVAIAGAILGSSVKIEKSEIKGEKSEGMVVDNSELGMKNNGLLVLNQTDIGKSLPEINIEFGDAIFDIDNKSLTHRPDLMGHRGFARELSAIFDRPLSFAKPEINFGSEKIAVEIKSDKCRRFCTIKCSGIKVEPSKLDVQVRLENLGTKAISNVVDTTNEIMMEFGQPMHAFDASKIEGGIIVRAAKNGEKLLALDGVTYELNENDLVVADEKKALSIAGIMGGMETSVTEGTTEIIFEAANFDPVSIRKTSQKLGLRSESSMRYEKSLDPEKCEISVLAAAEKIINLCKTAKVASKLTDVYPIKFPKIEIKLTGKKVRRIAGFEISDQEIAKKLTAIGFEVDGKEGVFNVKIPSDRATKDVAIAEDLIEEIVRLHGFENIKSSLPTLPINPPRVNLLREMEWGIRSFFASRNFLEVYNYSFVSEADQTFSGNGKYVEIQNPLSGEYKFLRKNMASNFVKNCESELRTHSKLDFFELGKTFEDSGNVLPNEKLKLAIFSAEIGGNENEKFFKIKSDVLAFFDTMNLIVEFRPTKSTEKYLHPAKSTDIFVENKKIGVIAAIHPKSLEVKNATAIFTEIDIEDVLKAVKKIDLKYQKLSPFPSIFRDISIVLDDKILISEIEKIAISASSLLKKIDFFDEFVNIEKLGANKKNLAFHCEFQSSENTISDEMIDKNFSAIVKALNNKFGTELRSEFDASRKL
jgi:phenylalanyl-tRNA synthetase beta chain